MALPFDTPGKLERRIAAGMADQSSDSSLGGLGLGRGSSAYRIGSGRLGDGAQNMSLSLSSSASYDDEDSRQQIPRTAGLRLREGTAQDENRAAEPIRQRKISPLPKSSVLGERSINAPVHNSRPTLAKAVATSMRADESVASEASSRERKTGARNTVSSPASSHASSSDVRVRSPPLTSTPHPLRGSERPSSPQRSTSSVQPGTTADLKARARARISEGRPASAHDSYSRTASAGFRSAVEESPMAHSRSSGTATPSPQRVDSLHIEKSQSSRDRSTGSSSGIDGSMGEADPRQGLSGAVDTAQPEIAADANPREGQDVMASEQEDGTMSIDSIRWQEHDEQSHKHPLATPRPAKVDQEYMRTYVLSAVKASHPHIDMRLQQLTPRPSVLRKFENGRLPGSASRALATLPAHLRQQVTTGPLPESSSTYAESTSSDVSSTRDLTVPAHLGGRGNSSLPDTGPELNAAGPGARVDAARLQGYLHKINLQLEGENVALREEQDELQRQFERALLDNEKLRNQLETAQQVGSSSLCIRTPTKGDEREQEIEELKAGIDDLNKILDERDGEIERLKRLNQQVGDAGMQERINELQDELDEERRASDEERRRFDEIINEARMEADQAMANTEQRFDEQRQKLESELHDLRRSVEKPAENDTDEMGRLRGTLHLTNAQLEDTNAQLDEALQEIQYLERQLSERYDMQREAENQVDDLKIAVAELEAEINEIKEQADRNRTEADEAKDKAFDLGIAVEEKQSDVIRLEMLLRQAQNSPEVTRLKEKVTLLESQLSAARAVDSPRRSDGPANKSAATPMHPSVAALRKPIDTPRSPAELGSASWLYHDSTLGENAVLRDIAALRGQVETAHAATDDVIAKLSASQMAEKIVQMQTELERMQDEASRQRELEARFRRRIERLRCGQCRSRLSAVELDASFDTTVTVTADNASQERTSRQASQKDKILADVAQQLNELKSKWAVDQARLAAEQEALQEARKSFDDEKKRFQTENDRLRLARRDSKREDVQQARRAQQSTLQDLSRARRMISDFEREFHDDCERFEQALRHSEGATQATAEVERELSQTKTHLARVDKELKAKVEMFEKLEAELDESSQMDIQLPLKIERLENDVHRFYKDVERLRQERNDILQKRQSLFVRQRKSQHDYINMHEELKSAREAIAAHQQQLDEQVNTIENLHATLLAQSKTLEKAHDDRDRLQKQRQAILQDVALLETDLRRVRDESRRFGEDLAALRRSKGESAAAPNSKASASTSEELVHMRKQHQAELARMLEQQSVHDTELRAQHRAQCQGLLLQIRYEKAKFMRESDLRADLIHQKRYILGVLGGLEMTEEATVRFLADIEKSRKSVRTSTEKRPKTVDVHSQKQGNVAKGSGSNPSLSRFRAAGWAVLAVCRARIMARNWQTTTSVKRALRQAHHPGHKAFP